MTDINIKIERYADKENLKKLMRYSKAKFATQSEINEKFYTKEQVDTKLESVSSEIDTKLTSKANTSDLATVATSGSYNDLLDKPTSFDVDLSNYYTKTQIDTMFNNAGSDKYGMSITADESEGGYDAQGGLSFWHAVERAPGYDGTSQMNIAEDSNTVEDE